METSLDYRLWQWYAYTLKSVLEFARWREEVFLYQRRMPRTKLPFMSLVSDPIKFRHATIQCNCTLNNAILLNQCFNCIITMSSSVLLTSYGLADSGVVQTRDVLHKAFPNPNAVWYGFSGEMRKAEPYVSKSLKAPVINILNKKTFELISVHTLEATFFPWYCFQLVQILIPTDRKKQSHHQGRLHSLGMNSISFCILLGQCT